MARISSLTRLLASGRADLRSVVVLAVFVLLFALAALLVALPGGITELMCHPGYHDTDLVVSSYDREREQELCALCDATVREAIARSGIRRIGYRDLPGALEARS